MLFLYCGIPCGVAHRKVVCPNIPTNNRTMKWYGGKGWMSRGGQGSEGAEERGARSKGETPIPVFSVSRILPAYAVQQLRQASTTKLPHYSHTPLLIHSTTPSSFKTPLRISTLASRMGKSGSGLPRLRAYTYVSSLRSTNPTNHPIWFPSCSVQPVLPRSV